VPIRAQQLEQAPGTHWPVGDRPKRLSPSQPAGVQAEYEIGDLAFAKFIEAEPIARP
jgi:hypothetical protein